MQRFAWLFALSIVPLSAPGHHSNTEYDFSSLTELEGEVTEVLWRNPHVLLTLRTSSASGDEQMWTLEAQDINSLGRRGLSADTIVAGNHVKVAGNPSRTRERLFVTNVLLPTGTEVRMRGDDTAPRWSTRTAGFAAPSRADATANALAARGLFRVWMRDGQARMPSLPLTPAALEVSEKWDPANSPALKCVPPGMPMATLASGPHPIDIAERNGDVVIRTETFDIVRTVHIKTAANPEQQPPTTLGYSIGEWDGDALIVRTTRINWPYFDPFGRVPISEDVVVDERFAVDPATDQLVYDLTVTDPETLTEPVKLRARYNWHPELTVEPYECTLVP